MPSFISSFKKYYFPASFWHCTAKHLEHIFLFTKTNPYVKQGTLMVKIASS